MRVPLSVSLLLSRLSSRSSIASPVRGPERTFVRAKMPVHGHARGGGLVQPATMISLSTQISNRPLLYAA